MSYFMRAFCTGGDVPSAASLYDHLLLKGLEVTVEASLKISTVPCRQAEFVYDGEKTPIVVTCDRLEDKGALFQKEIEEFLEQIGPPGLSLSKRKVIRHLRESKFAVVLRLPSDIDKAGFQVSDAILDYCVAHCGGMIQADGEGFYKGTKLILPLH